ncbi:UNVERIFIED_CONTAM: hypothetical protein Slati_2528800 [Sesamum latifolium]|uniref:Endonuclease/exonuclease/phosphatase domain-containing protein n=1 Tax=Sesamum latifolium TaxID=2727402 RepID=A0AAW2WFB6_9LAMI
MDIIKIQAIHKASEIEAEDIQENSDNEEEGTPIFNRFQSPEDSDSFLELVPELQVIQNNSQYLHVKINAAILPEEIYGTFIYAKCCRTPRKLLWEDLKKLSLPKVPWIVGGDLNAILHTTENQGGVTSSLGSIEDFNDMIFETGLTDAGFEGEPFTWTNKRVWRRLDRVLYSQEWSELFTSKRVTHLARRLSDHHPLLISTCKTENSHASSFRFQNMWIKHHNFLDTVKHNWCLPIQGSGMYKLQQKIYRLKDRLKTWNKDTFGECLLSCGAGKSRSQGG